MELMLLDTETSVCLPAERRRPRPKRQLQADAANLFREPEEEFMTKTTGLKTKSDYAKVIAAAMAGNALEFYDLFIYGFLAIVIAKVFFPAGSEIVSLLITVATFGASYIMRPEPLHARAPFC